ncbi:MULTISPECIES: RNA-directed DNA polymerase [unclassified Photorhabdus]|uniref:RNA-directed DNA polymerase n=1 Tax=unclassified Photorhabdus TaxID=2620880 RepID=UPI000E59FCA0|nr:RNA-directed DNA polymerase [Photorhabdus sp. CRCIA-P01]
MSYNENDWDKEHLLSFPINVKAVIAHMRQDMRDDWFPDPLSYNDLFEKADDLREVLMELLLEGNGRYEGNLRNLCNIPKKGLGIRYSLETDFYDRFIYQAICSFLIPFFDPLLSPRVLGHRYNKKRTKEKYLFKSRIELWQTFEGVTYTAITSSKALMATDVLNYFENISIDKVKESFELLIPQVKANGAEKLKIRNAINTLCELLCKWGFSKFHGLPQNRDPSSFIANVMLNSIDQKMVVLGYDYYRYVDDIRIICPDISSARRSLIELIGALRTIGMNINSSKTKILTSDSDKDLVAEFFPSLDDRSITIDNMWKSRNRRIIARSAKYIHAMIKDCIERQETQSRQFRFAVNRLIKLVDANVFDVHSSLGEELLDMIISTFIDHPASTDQYCRLICALQPLDKHFEKITDFLCDHDSAIHSWQNYHIWLTLAYHNFKSDQLIETACERLNLISNDPEVAAVFIYLSCIGETEKLIPVISQFDASWPNRHQRSFLLATKDLPQDSLKKIVEKLTIKLRNTARRATPHYYNNRPLAERKFPKIVDLYDEVTTYD